MGPTEKRIIKYLALNPGQFISGIKNGLNKKYNRTYDQSTISKAVKKLNQEKQLVNISDHKITEKKVTWPIYGLSNLGRSYVLSLNDPEISFLTIMENYQDDELFSSFKSFYNILLKHLKEKNIKQLETTIGKVGLAVWNSDAMNIDEAYAIIGGMVQGWAYIKSTKSPSFEKKWNKAIIEIWKNPKSRKFISLTNDDIKFRQDQIVVSKKMKES